MMNKNKSSVKVKDILSWFGMLVVTASAFFCTYSYSLSKPVVSILWISWLIAMFVLAYFTTQGLQALNFSKEAKIELQKVIWPTRPETIQITLIVMVMVTITGTLLWGVDSLMMLVIGKITHLG